LKRRAHVKTLRYIILDVEGTQQFTTNVFIDGQYEVKDGGETFTDNTLFTDDQGFVKFEPDRTPALQLQFVGKDAGGFGLQSFGTSPFGGGNNTGIRNDTLEPTKFKTMKLRFEGETMGPLKFIALTLLYQGGSIRRMQL